MGRQRTMEASRHATGVRTVNPLVASLPPLHAASPLDLSLARSHCASARESVTAPDSFRRPRKARRKGVLLSTISESKLEQLRIGLRKEGFSGFILRPGFVKRKIVALEFWMALECGTDSERKRSYSHYLSRILGPQCDGTTISLLPDPPLSLRFPLLRRRRRYLCPLSSISLLFRTLKGRERRETGAAAPDYPASFTSLLFIHSSIHASIHLPLRSGVEYNMFVHPNVWMGAPS